jgi:hypothetical protein
MNHEEAQAKAQKLWGDGGFAIPMSHNCYLVGEKDQQDPAQFQHIYGAGATWELAFHDAWLSLN